MRRSKAITRTEVVVVIAIILMLLGVWLWPPVTCRCPRPFHAIRGGDLDYVKQHVREKFIRPDNYSYALEIAIESEHLPICQYFIEELHTPLEEKHFVSGLESQNVEILLYLLEKGVPVNANAKTDDGRNIQDLIDDLLNAFDSKEEDESVEKLKELLQPHKKHGFTSPFPEQQISQHLG